MAAIGGTFIGLVLGGLLAPISWRLVFLISVPVGVMGTIWSYLKLQRARHPQAGQTGLVGQRDLRRRA